MKKHSSENITFSWAEKNNPGEKKMRYIRDDSIDFYRMSEIVPFHPFLAVEGKEDSSLLHLCCSYRMIQFKHVTSWGSFAFIFD